MEYHVVYHSLCYLPGPLSASSFIANDRDYLSWLVRFHQIWFPNGVGRWLVRQVLGDFAKPRLSDSQVVPSQSAVPCVEIFRQIPLTCGGSGIGHSVHRAVSAVLPA